MTRPHYEDTLDSLLTDEHILERVAGLIDRALRRQIWLMFLDGEGRQLPLLMPCDVPRRPADAAFEVVSEFFRGSFDEANASSMIVVLERRGRDAVTEADREWLRLVHDACAEEEIPLRGPLLAHSQGVRWVAAEDYLIA